MKIKMTVGHKDNEKPDYETIVDMPNKVANELLGVTKEEDNK